MDDKGSRELYLEYQGLSQQLQQVQQFLQRTSDNVAEATRVVESIEELGKVKKGSRVFAPIANGIFIDATLNDPQTVRMNVGAGTVVEKSVDEAKELLIAQRDELESLRGRATMDNAQLVKRLRRIEAELQAAQETVQE